MLDVYGELVPSAGLGLQPGGRHSRPPSAHGAFQQAQLLQQLQQQQQAPPPTPRGAEEAHLVRQEDVLVALAKALHKCVAHLASLRCVSMTSASSIYFGLVRAELGTVSQCGVSCLALGVQPGGHRARPGPRGHASGRAASPDFQFMGLFSPPISPGVFPSFILLSFPRPHAASQPGGKTLYVRTTPGLNVRLLDEVDAIARCALPRLLSFRTLHLTGRLLRSRVASFATNTPSPFKAPLPRGAKRSAQSFFAAAAAATAGTSVAGAPPSPGAAPPPQPPVLHPAAFLASPAVKAQVAARATVVRARFSTPADASDLGRAILDLASSGPGFYLYGKHVENGIEMEECYADDGAGGGGGGGGGAGGTGGFGTAGQSLQGSLRDGTSWVAQPAAGGDASAHDASGGAAAAFATSGPASAPVGSGAVAGGGGVGHGWVSHRGATPPSPLHRVSWTQLQPLGTASLHQNGVTRVASSHLTPPRDGSSTPPDSPSPTAAAAAAAAAAAVAPPWPPFSMPPGVRVAPFAPPTPTASAAAGVAAAQPGMTRRERHARRRACFAALAVEEALSSLSTAEARPPLYGAAAQVAALAIASAGCAPVFFKSSWLDGLIAGLLGAAVAALGTAATSSGVRLVRAYEFLAATMVALLGRLVDAYIAHICYQPVILSALIWLVQGWTLTNAVVEIATRNPMSGTSHLFQGIIVTALLGFGVLYVTPKRGG